MVTGGDGHGLILNAFLESFDACLSFLFAIVAILGMSSGLTGRSAKISAGFIILV